MASSSAPFPKSMPVCHLSVERLNEMYTYGRGYVKKFCRILIAQPDNTP